MKKIEAIVRPERLEDVKSALEDVEYSGLMLTRIEGHGNQKGIVQQFGGRKFTVELLPKYKIELVCSDEMCDPIVQAIVAAGRTGEIGDGKVFVSTIDDAIRIRTGESGVGAL